jgi:hypothetical protein
MDQAVGVATGILAARAGMGTDDPEPQIAARALLGLWHVQAESLRKHLDAPPARLHDLVTADVRRAAQLIDSGLRSFAAPTAEQGGTSGGHLPGSPAGGSASLPTGR